MWWRSLPRHLQTTPEAQQVVARYGTLFPLRTLMCRYCLKLAYGCHPDATRRWYAKKKEKAAGETRPA